MVWLWRRPVALLRGSIPRRHRGPRPLRSAAYPLKLPGLRGVDRKRVLQANKLYRFCREVMEGCEERNILCMVENPENSLFWLTRYMLNPPSSFRRHCLRACMYGSKRLKKTAFLINFDAPNMRVACDDSHPHLPWSNRLEVDPSTQQTRRVFDTASEANTRRACAMPSPRPLAWNSSPEVLHGTWKLSLQMKRHCCRPTNNPVVNAARCL